VLLAAIALPLAAQTGTAPAPAAATQDESPATTPAIAFSPPDTAPLPPSATVKEGLRYDEAEQAILAATKDHIGNISDSGLYVLLRRAVALPQLEGPRYKALSTINADELLDRPAAFRGTPVRLLVGVYKVQEWTSGAKGQFHISPRWPRERKIWWIGGTDYTGETPSRRRIVVLSVVDPRPLLGEPLKIDAEGAAVYGVGRYLDMAAIFYKVYDDMSVGNEKSPPTKMSYPVFVAWQAQPTNTGSDPMQWMWIAGAVSLAALIGLFFFFRQKAKQAKISNPNVGFRNYRPLREAEPALTKEAPTVKEEPVDPALREAVERFQKDQKNG